MKYRASKMALSQNATLGTFSRPALIGEALCHVKEERRQIRWWPLVCVCECKAVCLWGRRNSEWRVYSQQRWERRQQVRDVQCKAVTQLHNHSGTQMKCATVKLFVLNPPTAEVQPRGSRPAWRHGPTSPPSRIDHVLQDLSKLQRIFPKPLAVFGYAAPCCKLSERLMGKKFANGGRCSPCNHLDRIFSLQFNWLIAKHTRTYRLVFHS